MNALRHALIPLLLLLGPAAGAFCQGGAAVKPIDLKAKLKLFKQAATDRKAARDAEAGRIIDSLMKDDRYDALDKKSKAQVLAALKFVLTSHKVRRKPENRRLFDQVTVLLGGMGAPGAKVLVGAYVLPKFKKREWVSMRAAMLKAIGRTKDVTRIKFLLDRASRDPQDPIMAAAGAALSNFEDKPQKIRKLITKELIKKFGEVYGKAKQSLDPGDAQRQRSNERWAAISDPWNRTLARMTGKNYRDPPDWVKFWNKHKNDNWDRGRAKPARGAVKGR